MKRETLSLLFFYGGADLITFMCLSLYVSIFICVYLLCAYLLVAISTYFSPTLPLCHFILALGSYLRVAQQFL